MRRIVCLNTLTCLEAELSDYFLRGWEEDRVLDSYKNRSATTENLKKEWFIGQPFTHDVLFHLCSKSSVSDVVLRRQLLRESKKEASMKDFITFFMLGVFLPRATFTLSALNLAKNSLLNLDIENEKVISSLEMAQLGKYARLLFVALPLTAFV